MIDGELSLLVDGECRKVEALQTHSFKKDEKLSTSHF